MAKKVAKKVHLTPIWYGIIMIIIGALLIVGGAGVAEQMSKIIITVIGAVLVIYAILNLVAGLVSLGVVQLVFGILMICFAWFFYWIAFLVLGIVLFINSLTKLIKKQGSIIANIIGFVVGTAIILLGFGFNFGWANTVIQVIYIIAGVLLVIDGVLFLVKRK